MTGDGLDFRKDFRRREPVEGLVRKIADLAGDRRLRFMEVCGGHTAAMLQFGLHDLLPKNLELLSGPGCPVCVTPDSLMLEAVRVARKLGTTLLTFGDMMRVPTSQGSLSDAVSTGASVEVVYSPLQCLEKAEKCPERQFVFLAIGFETTAPGSAVMILKARERRLRNLRILSGHKTMPEAMGWLVTQGEVALDGFICPGHVSTIIGTRPYEFLAREHGIPCAIAGFEPVDLLYAVHSLVEQSLTGRARVDDCYSRSVQPEGNTKALGILQTVFEPCDARWRGLGTIPSSGLTLREHFHGYDVSTTTEPESLPGSDFAQGCLCGDVLRGVIRPHQCPLFSVRCTPESPVGPCMVSSEGSCNVHCRLEGDRG